MYKGVRFFNNIDTNQTTMPRTSELLMPAGNLQKLKMAILYGADAVYLGTPDMSLRTKSAFSLEEVVEGVEFCHKHGKRAYLTLNLFSHNKDVAKLEEYIDTVRKVKPDGLIIADPGIFQYVKDRAPELELHISTQANVCSYLSVDFWQKQGASLVVLAREVTYAELAEIRQHCPDVKLEAFVHGAMCMTYSGRCMLSNYMVERGANQGNCANSCRWNYKVHMKLKDGSIQEIPLNEHTKEMFEFFLEEGVREGELMPIEENERGTYILNAKDLCLMPKLDDYLKIGIDSLKVEGRNKSQYYVGLVARAYRRAIDAYYADPENWDYKPYMDELYKVQNRGYSLAFHDGRLTNMAHNYEDTHSLAEYEFAGLVNAVDDEFIYMQVKNKIVAGDVLEFVPPSSDHTILLRIYEFHDAAKDIVTESVSAGQQPVIKIPLGLFDQEDTSGFKELMPELTIVRKEKALTKDEFDRIKLDKEAHAIEMGGGSQISYDKRLDSLQTSLDAQLADRVPKTPRIGIEGCCGKGCNGCLMFWHDPLYEKARELMKAKKQGQMLDRDMKSEAKVS